MHFLCNVYPYTPFVLFFVPFFTFLGLFPSQMAHLLPVPNMEWAVYKFVSLTFPHIIYGLVWQWNQSCGHFKQSISPINWVHHIKAHPQACPKIG